MKLGGGVPPILQTPIKTVKAARRLRKNMSLPEGLLWRELRKRPAGLKFRKQFPIDRFVLDFMCLETRVGIEIDGEAHNRGDQPRRDAARDALLAKRGIVVLRLPARDVLGNMEGCIQIIVSACDDRGPLHQLAAGPPPRSGEEL